MSSKQETGARPCTCANAWQDQTYGRGQRIHNQTSKGWRCTSCSNETTGGGFLAGPEKAGKAGK